MDQKQVEEEPAEAKEPESAKAAGLVNEEDPKGFQSRMNDLYGKMKASDRRAEEMRKKFQERDEDIRLMREHNAQLEQSIGVVNTKVEEAKADPPPDPEEDMAGYLKWMTQSFEAKLNTVKSGLVQTSFDSQVADMREDYEDYEEVVKLTQSAMSLDSTLKTKILGSRNPAKAAYRYGKKKLTTDQKKQEENDDRGKAKDQMQVEGSNNQQDTSKTTSKLNSAQKRVAKLMGVSEEKYAKQLFGMGA